MFFSISPEPIRVGQIGSLRIQLEDNEKEGFYWFRINGHDDVPFPGGTGTGNKRNLVGSPLRRNSDFEPEVQFSTTGSLVVWSRFVDPAKTAPTNTVLNQDAGWTKDHPPVTTILPATNPTADSTVALVAADPPVSGDEVLWRFISAISRRMRFDEFRDYVQPKLPAAAASWSGANVYTRLKELAYEFVVEAAVPTNVSSQELSATTVSAALKKSYVADIVPPSEPFLSYQYGDDDPPDEGERFKFPLDNVPFVELLWNYFVEEGMLVQTLNHIVARFQNRRPGPGIDPLLRFDLNPLMPMRTLLWNYAEDESNRLTVRRRSAEYEYEYGLRLRGRAIPHASILADRRGQFLEGFHRLLHACVLFYKERDDKTVDADAFPLLSNLQEVHLVLARGAHNQYANLALTARAEMLTMQWLLAQPEMHEFLGGPTMIPYEEPWMDRVDTMKSLQGWSDTSVTHFFELAVQGEQILLSVRHGRWNESKRKREDAANWALIWRNEIQRYIHSYATVTGIDLTAIVDATMPSELINRRLMQQRRRA